MFKMQNKNQYIENKGNKRRTPLLKTTFRVFTISYILAAIAKRIGEVKPWAKRKQTDDIFPNEYKDKAPPKLMAICPIEE
jgi:hypothetical protein